MTKRKELKAQIEKLYQEIKVLNEVDDDCRQRKEIQELKSMINFVDTILEAYKYEI